MATKKPKRIKKQLAPVAPIKSTPQMEEFEESGRSDTDTAPSTSSTKKERGTVDWHKLLVAFYPESIEDLRDLAYQWRKDSGSRKEVPVSVIVRSLLEVAMPVLNDIDALDGDADEDELTERLRQAFQDHYAA